MGFGELALLALGVSMDAFAVSICKGLCMRKATLKAQATCGAWFGGFQGLMPLIGWICIHTIVQYFRSFEKLIPWIALILLSFIGTSLVISPLMTSVFTGSQVGVVASLYGVWAWLDRPLP